MASLAGLGPDPRLLVGMAGNEDAVVVRFPAGKALVQTVDFFTPIVDDPYHFGRIAAANALSDIYAMGGDPLSAMNIVCFPIKTAPREVLTAILQGGLDMVREAGAVLAGGHSVEDEEIKYGLAVNGLIDEDLIATNAGLAPGDLLVLTKPLGTGVLATAVKARWQGAPELEALLTRWAARLNRSGAEVIRRLKLRAATDVTGFGLGGHLLEMARASKVTVRLDMATVPFMEPAVELASMGLLPAGGFANKGFCSKLVQAAEDLDPVRLDLIFDPQTSGGLVLAVPPGQLQEAISMLLDAGDMAEVVGEVEPADDSGPKLRIV